LFETVQQYASGFSGKSRSQSGPTDARDVFIFLFFFEGSVPTAGFKEGQSGQLPRASTTSGPPQNSKKIVT